MFHWVMDALTLQFHEIFYEGLQEFYVIFFKAFQSDLEKFVSQIFLL